MKLNISYIKVFFLLAILITGNLCTTMKSALKNSSTTKDEKGVNPNVESVKLLFMYKYPDVRNEKNHKLNLFTYKNVLFSNDQIIYFGSPNEGDEAKDEKYETSKYLITMRYEFLDIPCLNKSFVCTHSQFMKEYKSIYPELKFDVPKEVQEKFGDSSKASENCLLIFLNSISSLEEAAWLCHTDPKTVLQIQLKLSKIIYDANVKNYDFVASYVQNKNTITPGIMNLTKDKFVFTDFDEKEIIKADWKDVEPYANSLYLKEQIVWTGPEAEKPDSQRCLKLLRVSELANDNPDYFCIYIHRNDITQRIKLTEAQGRFAAELYANKINIRLQNVKTRLSLVALSKMDQKSISVDSKLLFPIKMDVRNKYFIKRHSLVIQVKLGQLKKSDLNAKLHEGKEQIINKVCAGIELCKKAIGFCTDKELLPLKGVREKFAFDMQNPFNRLMPQINIKIDSPKEGSKGKEIMSAIAKIKGSLNYFAEPVPESSTGESPNHISIRKAFNTFLNLRERKEYKKLDELGVSCKSNERHSSNSIRRKIAFLMYAGENDIFFEYLGYIRDFQLTKK